ncbi:MAG: hypothetical protein WDN29_10325 [Methylovirgula sp.]
MVYYPVGIAATPRVTLSGLFGAVERQASRPDPKLNDVYADFTLTDAQLNVLSPGAQLELTVNADDGTLFGKWHLRRRRCGDAEDVGESGCRRSKIVLHARRRCAFVLALLSRTTHQQLLQVRCSVKHSLICILLDIAWAA